MSSNRSEYGLAGAIQVAIEIMLCRSFLKAALVGAMANPKRELVSSLLLVVFAIFLPVFYGVFGFLMGATGAGSYNLVLKWTGGLN
jgi:hypothetical protein